MPSRAIGVRLDYAQRRAAATTPDQRQPPGAAHNPALFIRVAGHASVPQLGEDLRVLVATPWFHQAGKRHESFLRHPLPRSH